VLKLATRARHTAACATDVLAVAAPGPMQLTKGCC